MTYAMWGIVTGMVLIFGVSLLRYGHSLVREQETRGAVDNDSARASRTEHA